MPTANSPVINLLDSIKAEGDHPNVEIVFDVPELRLVRFDLGSGVEVGRHQSDSVVTMYALAGDGTIVTGNLESPFRAGDLVVCGRNETHGFSAGGGGLAVLAAIAPSPG